MLGAVTLSTLLLAMTTLPLFWSNTVQSPVSGHATPNRSSAPSTLVTDQAVVPPVGLAEVTALPLPSAAMQRWLLGQDTSFRELPPSTVIAVHVGDTAAGLLEVTTSPRSSTATQRSLLKQDTPLRL